MTSNLYLLGLASSIGTERLSVDDVVKSGGYSATTAAADGYHSVAREPGRASYEMALDSAKAALIDADVSSSDVAGLVYGSIHRHGQPRLWSPASWVQRQLAMPGSTPVLVVQQGCNGLLQSMAMMRSAMYADPTRPSLFVGADRFEASGFDRWESDYGLVYGDAAAAILLSARTGFARIVHLEIDGAPELEELHRDPSATPEGPGSWREEYDVKRSKKTFLEAHGQEGFTKPLNAALARLKAGLLSDPEWSGPVKWIFTPFVGSKIRQTTYEAAFGDLGHHSGWEIGKTLGHLGTTDGWVGLQYLRAAGKLTSGDRVLIVSAGVGFSCGLALIEIM